MRNEKMHKFPLNMNRMEIWQKNEKNVKFPLNDIWNWEIMNKFDRQTIDASFGQQSYAKTAFCHI